MKNLRMNYFFDLFAWISHGFGCALSSSDPNCHGICGARDSYGAYVWDACGTHVSHYFLGAHGVRDVRDAWAVRVYVEDK